MEDIRQRLEQLSTAAASCSSEELTFGIEFEFLLVGDFEEAMSRLGVIGSTGDLGADLVRKVLTDDGKIDVFRCNELYWNATHDPDWEDCCTNHYKKWTVETDCSVYLTSKELRALPKDHDGECVELKTPIFSLRNDNWKEQITYVLSLLHSELNSTENGSTFRLITNKSCGMHIHIGKGKNGERFSVRTIKNLYQFVTGFERLIDEMHPVDRIQDHIQDANKSGYCIPPSSRFQNIKDLEQAGGNPLSWCQCVENEVSSLCDLYTITGGLKAAAYNLNPTTPLTEDLCSQQNKRSKWTVEFRQHRGTLDAAEAIAWLEFLVALVRFAERTPHFALWNLLKTHVENPNYGLFDLFETIGAPGSLIQYYQQRMSNDKAGSDLGETDPSWRRVMELNREEKERRIDPKAVRQAVARKLLRGEYGLYDPQVLQEIALKYTEDIYISDVIDTA